MHSPTILIKNVNDSETKHRNSEVLTISAKSSWFWNDLENLFLASIIQCILPSAGLYHLHASLVSNSNPFLTSCCQPLPLLFSEYPLGGFECAYVCVCVCVCLPLYFTTHRLYLQTLRLPTETTKDCLASVWMRRK